jgi:UDP-glucose 4-epimerase
MESLCRTLFCKVYVLLLIEMPKTPFKTIVVCGGAGYVGSFVTRSLFGLTQKVVVVDNFSNGHRESLANTEAIIIEGDVSNKAFLRGLFSETTPDLIIHLCAYLSVGESLEDPLLYYRNNLLGMITILECMKESSIPHIIFSSSCTTFGSVSGNLVDESHPFNPISPYGETKLFCEFMLKSFSNVSSIKYVTFRYFNVAGGSADGSFGEGHRNETHLLPIVFQVVLNQRGTLKIYGTDYATKDGTCVRDYIHPYDIANAHLCAISHFQNGGDSDHFNLGSGRGYSVLEIVENCRKITHHPIPAEIGARRPGDPAHICASSEKASNILNWFPQHSEIDEIIKTAWEWHRKHPSGYNSFSN